MWLLRGRGNRPELPPISAAKALIDVPLPGPNWHVSNKGSGKYEDRYGNAFVGAAKTMRVDAKPNLSAEVTIHASSEKAKRRYEFWSRERGLPPVFNREAQDFMGDQSDRWICTMTDTCVVSLRQGASILSITGLPDYRYFTQCNHESVSQARELMMKYARMILDNMKARG